MDGRVVTKRNRAPKPEGWEDKTKIRERFNKTGLWHEFVAAREELRKQGLSPDECWQGAAKKLQGVYDQKVLALASAKVGELLEPVAPIRLVDAEVCQEVAKLGAVNFRSDIEWAYLNKNNKAALPTDAPNLGAYGLMQWARDHEHEFYTSIFSKVLPTKGQLDADQAKTDDGGAIKLLEQIELMRKELNEVPETEAIAV